MLQLLQQQQKQKEEQAAKQKQLATPTKRNLPANSVVEGQPIVCIPPIESQKGAISI